MTVVLEVPATPVMDAFERRERLTAAATAVQAALHTAQGSTTARPCPRAGAAAMAIHSETPLSELQQTDWKEFAGFAADLLADLLHLAHAAHIPAPLLALLCDRHRQGALVPAAPADRTVAEGISMCWNNVVSFLSAAGLLPSDVKDVLKAAHRLWAIETA